MSVTSNTIKTHAFTLSRPRVTEKATYLAGAKNPVYTFEVPKNANKTEVKKAVEAKYKVKPVKVTIVSLPTKKVFVRGKLGSKTGVKKALVFLKAGDKIELV